MKAVARADAISIADVHRTRAVLRHRGIEMLAYGFTGWAKLLVAIDVWLEGGLLEIPAGLYWTRSGHRDTVALVTLDDCIRWRTMTASEIPEQTMVHDGLHRLGWSVEPVRSPPAEERDAEYALVHTTWSVENLWPRHYRHPTVPAVGFMHRKAPDAGLYNHVRRLLRNYLVDRSTHTFRPADCDERTERYHLFGDEAGVATEDCPHRPRDRHFLRDLDHQRLVAWIP